MERAEMKRLYLARSEGGAGGSLERQLPGGQSLTTWQRFEQIALVIAGRP